MDYLIGAKKKTNEDDPTFQTWDTENSMVMSWLIHSMDDDISQNFLLYPTTKIMWDAANKR